MTLNEKIRGELTEFRKFSKRDVGAAIIELKKIKKDENRKHLQRLVYANQIDRFDVLIDNLLLEFAIDSTSSFHERILNKVSDNPVSQKSFFKALLDEEPSEVAKNEIQKVARSEFLRSRHSAKLRMLLEDCFEVPVADLNKSRVNANDGRIQTTFKRRSRTVPSSIIGYADYLYCRRSGIVHGTGSSISDRDSKYLSQKFDAKTKAIGIKLSSISSASKFYEHLVDFMLENRWPPSRNF